MWMYIYIYMYINLGGRYYLNLRLKAFNLVGHTYPNL